MIILLVAGVELNDAILVSDQIENLMIRLQTQSSVSLTAAYEHTPRLQMCVYQRITGQRYGYKV